MKNVYIIASAAAKNMQSENILWDALRKRGWQVRDIHDLPRIEQHDITVVGPELARIIQKRFSKTEKHAIVISLNTSTERLMPRMVDTPIEKIQEQLELCQNLSDAYADAWYPGDDLEEAAILIQRFIEKMERE